MKVFWGKWDSWGLEISWCNSDKTFAISLVHWYFAICFWKLWKFDFKGAGIADRNECDTCDEFEMLDKEAYEGKING